MSAFPETEIDTINLRFEGLTRHEQDLALSYLWGLMTIRDLQACIDSIAYAKAVVEQDGGSQ